MTIIDSKDGYFTLINTFTVDPAEADRLLKALSDATVNIMRQRPGFISANLHMSNDKTRVANYAQWRSQADFDAMRADEAARAHMREAAEIAVSFDLVFYDLRETHTA